MINPLFIEREPPLARCPLPGCRRGGRCLFPGDDDPCRRLYEDKAAWRARFYTRLARAIMKENRGQPPVTPEQGAENIARVKRALDARLAEINAEEAMDRRRRGG